MQQMMMRRVFMGQSLTPPGPFCQALIYTAPRLSITAMSRAFVRSVCETLPGAEVSDPWGGGHDAWKVGGKVFALIGAMDQGVAVKTADTDFAAMMIEAGDASRVPYLHRSWVLLPWDTETGFMRDRILISYDLIRSKLPKKVQAALPARTD